MTFSIYDKNLLNAPKKEFLKIIILCLSDTTIAIEYAIFLQTLAYHHRAVRP